MGSLRLAILASMRDVGAQEPSPIAPQRKRKAPGSAVAKALAEGNPYERPPDAIDVEHGQARCRRRRTG